MVAEVVAISTAASMPCAHTSMVAFETTPEQLAQHGDPADTRNGLKSRNKSAITALAVGGTVCIVGASMAASAAAFGSVAGTMAGLSSFGDFDILAGGGGDMGADGECCDCCGEDDCKCCDAQDCACDCTVM
eukprot:SAG31_NODE_3695_length_3980_cov_6.104870_4_plen_132_part_00